MGAPAELLQMARTAANDAGVPFELLAGLVQTESAWNPLAVSSAGAVGLTQVMPWWLRSDKFKQYNLTPEDLKNPMTSLWIGSEILADELKRFGGSWELAAMAYNGGSPMVKKAIDRAGSTDPNAVSDEIPAAETQAYWKKVTKWAQHFAGMASEAEATVSEIAEDSGAFLKANKFVIGGLLLVLFLAARAHRG